MNRALRLCCLALTGLGCASQTLIMSRSSSGAVDRDIEFTPVLGADGHFISLPAYPLANCTDTLVYDRLVRDLGEMLLGLAKLPVTSLRSPRRSNGSPNSQAATDFWGQVVATHAGQLLTEPDFQASRADLAKSLIGLLHPDAAEGEKGVLNLRDLKKGPVGKIGIDGSRSIGTMFRRKRALIEHASDSELKAFLEGFITASAGDFDTLLSSGGKDKFIAQDMQTVIGGAVTLEESKAFSAAAADFVRLADDYGPAACSSHQRYRDFLGFRNDDPSMPDGSPPGGFHVRTPGISWLDRDSCAQLEMLRDIEGLLPNPPAKPESCTTSQVQLHWPKSLFSFLHFSDVQIREPSAKLGNPTLSHQLKSLVPSFEQDYVQEQYAMFVYDALVMTANAEIGLHGANDSPTTKEASRKPPWVTPALSSDDEDERPPPRLMIHTGDSVDAGLQSEFDTFVTITDTLRLTNATRLPWFQVIGNHDALAFGNMQLASPKAPRLLADAQCLGGGWRGVACTCTNINTLVRAQETGHPDNRGKTTSALPSKTMPVFPFLLQRICLLHAVAGDWFVMDPDKNGSGSSTKSFVQSHCKGWRPRPEDPTPDPLKARNAIPTTYDPNELALASCLSATAPPKTPNVVVQASLPAEKRAAVGVDPKAKAESVTPSDVHCATLDEQKRSAFHGFDLIPNFRERLDAVPATKDANDRLGYYCFEMGTPLHPPDQPSAKIWAIVLNTNTDAGSYGYISDNQIAWLRYLLEHIGKPESSIGQHDLVLLFAHHPIYSIYDQKQRLTLTDLVTRSKNVIGYFVGHTHASGLRVIRPLSGSAGTAKWEIVAPSVIDYPQAVRQVTLKTEGQLGYIEVLTFTSVGKGPAVEKIKAAELGAVRDSCTDPSHVCIDGHAVLPGREVTFPRAFFKMP